MTPPLKCPRCGHEFPVDEPTPVLPDERERLLSQLERLRLELCGLALASERLSEEERAHRADLAEVERRQKQIDEWQQELRITIGAVEARLEMQE